MTARLLTTLQQRPSRARPGVSSRDPTRTLALRRRFAAALRRRLREVLRLVRQAILVRDVFGMRHGPSSLVLRPLQRTRDTGQGTLLPPEEAFADGQEDQQVNAFMAWLWGVLTVTLLTPRRWWERYVRPAYDAGWQRGMQQAARQVLGPPTMPQVPGVPPAPVAALPTTLRPQTPAWRGLTDLMQGRMTQLTETTAQVMREAVSHTITQTPTAMADAVTAAMQPVLRRADVLAQTSLIEAHATGTLDALQLAGVTQVVPVIELVRFTTAGDNRVCPRCRALEGRVYTIAAARGVIPVHGNCRCTWVPVRARAAA